jgi:hypothetical protein
MAAIIFFGNRLREVAKALMGVTVICGPEVIEVGIIASPMPTKIVAVATSPYMSVASMVMLHGVASAGV